MQYDPYGEVLTSTLPAHLTDRLFAGQRLDSSTGLYYYNARYYDPYLGQFTQPDSLVADPLNPAAWNRYAYVYGNPVNHTDPTGHFMESPFDLADLLVDAVDCLGGDELSCVASAYDVVALAIPGVPATYGSQYYDDALQATRRVDDVFGVTERASDRAARLLMEEAATARGLAPGELDELVREIRLWEGPGAHPSFSPYRMEWIGDRWVADITTPYPTVELPSNIFELPRSSQLRMALHELEHALQWRAAYELAGGNMQKALELLDAPRRSAAYAVREILTEAAVLATLQDYLGAVPPAVWDESMGYIKWWMGKLN